jgi:WhiB family redox-sensing transcriptional regulator
VSDVRRLPKPVSEAWDWQLYGACRGLDVELFFHADNERGPRREARIRGAQAVCATCPVITQCAEHALTTREPYGVWGGLSEGDRLAILTRRDRAAAS